MATTIINSTIVDAATMLLNNNTMLGGINPYGPPLHKLDAILPMQTIYHYVDTLVSLLLSTNDMNIWLQYLIITAGAAIGALVLFMLVGPLSYWYFFVLKKDKYYPEGDPQPFPGQVALEIKMSLKAFPFLSLLTAPFFVLELRGYSRSYWNFSAENPFSWSSLALMIFVFIMFTDMGIYWVHRWEHTFPWIYQYIHKPHHKWIVPTPFASFAFHPLDGWAQSLPYHFLVFMFPMQVGVYLGLFVFVQLWTVSIHDGVDWCGEKTGSLRSYFLNGSLHHYIHHSKFLYNYGQYFTIWDRLMGSHLSWRELKEKQERLRRGDANRQKKKEMEATAAQ